MSFIHNVRALKGQAPTAGQFNKLASNLEYLKARVTPRYCLVKKSADQTASTGITGAPVAITFATAIADANSMFSAGTITIPTDAEYVRAVCNLYLSAIEVKNTTITLTAEGSAYQQFGWNAAQSNAAADGVRAFNLDTGWWPTSGVTSIGVYLNGPLSTSWTIKNDNRTWLFVEVL